LTVLKSSDEGIKYRDYYKGTQFPKRPPIQT
jgi:hypothetical protein